VSLKMVITKYCKVCWHNEISSRDLGYSSFGVRMTGEGDRYGCLALKRPWPPKPPHHILEDWNLVQHHCENIRSHICGDVCILMLKYFFIVVPKYFEPTEYNTVSLV
jgi:hypothetical protein